MSEDKNTNQTAEDKAKAAAAEKAKAEAEEKARAEAEAKKAKQAAAKSVKPSRAALVDKWLGKPATLKGTGKLKGRLVDGQKRVFNRSVGTDVSSVTNWHISQIDTGILQVVTRQEAVE